jgi:hypothetical protein
MPEMDIFLWIRVLDFVDRRSITRFMEAMENCSLLKLTEKFFCKRHGTKLLSSLDLSNNDDKPSSDSSSEHMNCEDCEMEKIGRKRCPDCDRFYDVDFLACCDLCEQDACGYCTMITENSRTCSSCFENLCQNQGLYLLRFVV